jgi:hypothetical protein
VLGEAAGEPEVVVEADVVEAGAPDVEEESDAGSGSDVESESADVDVVGGVATAMEVSHDSPAESDAGSDVDGAEADADADADADAEVSEGKVATKASAKGRSKRSKHTDGHILSATRKICSRRLRDMLRLLAKFQNPSVRLKPCIYCLLLYYIGLFAVF